MNRLSDYDYTLPERLIAQTPLERRSDARLLHLDRQTGAIRHRRFSEVPQILREGDLLVVNDTRVSALRIFGRKETGGTVEALLLREEAPGLFEALVKPARRLRPETPVTFEGGLVARMLAPGPTGLARLQFDLVGQALREGLAAAGETPLPPYIHARLADPERYQTVYASEGGSAAAPTAGLHFTPELLAELNTRGVKIARVSLDVSLDTFRPVKTEDLDAHRMHGETCRVSEETAEAVAKCSGRIFAVGTTTMRTLETFAVGPRRLRAGTEVSKLFIRPGHAFRIADGMFTNFHLPRTTMLVMLAAFSSQDYVQKSYTEAVENEYRFLSFGDSMLLL